MKISINPDKCIGCEKCIEACKIDHEISRVSIKKDKQKNYIPLICRQCNSPECAKACTYEAFYRDQNTGAVLIDPKTCQACHACVRACPFDSVKTDPKTGIAYTCDLCEGNPKCVEACNYDAIKIINDK